ncbi:ATP synthase F0 subunit C [Spiroplasma endosymbiont of Polydrusus formosus]|uniref:ATP synthase F0 subunit C n=1 Tax=Spiroplasma endosymbiont of Polydrusus formosus TaxID=3139326 RepID=UPI0035B56058
MIDFMTIDFMTIDFMTIDLMSNMMGIWLMTGINDGFTKGMSLLGAGLAAIGCCGSGIGQGYTGGKAVEAIARNPEVESKVRTQYIIAAAITESGSIYALVIAIILAFVTG